MPILYSHREKLMISAKWNASAMFTHVMARRIQCHAIIFIDDLQTEREAATRSTFIDNGIGWSVSDVKRGSRIAAQCREVPVNDRRNLDLLPIDAELVTSLVKRYSGQLAGYANSKSEGPRFAHDTDSGRFFGRGESVDWWVDGDTVTRRSGHKPAQRYTLPVKIAAETALFREYFRMLQARQ